MSSKENRGYLMALFGFLGIISCGIFTFIKEKTDPVAFNNNEYLCAVVITVMMGFVCLLFCGLIDVSRNVNWSGKQKK